MTLRDCLCFAAGIVVGAVGAVLFLFGRLKGWW